MLRRSLYCTVIHPVFLASPLISTRPISVPRTTVKSEAYTVVLELHCTQFSIIVQPTPDPQVLIPPPQSRAQLINLRILSEGGGMNRGIAVRFPAAAEYSSPLQNVQSSSGALPASYSEDKAAEA